MGAESKKIGIHVTANHKAAMLAANNPYAANPFATIEDLSSGSAITNDVMPRGNAAGDGIEDGTWNNIGNHISPAVTGSNIGDDTHRIGTLFMSSNINHSSDLNFNVGVINYHSLLTSGQVLFCKTGQYARFGDQAVQFTEIDSAIVKTSSVSAGGTWSGYHSFTAGAGVNANAAFVSNKNGYNAIRLTHDLRFETGWNGVMGGSSTQAMTFFNATGNLALGTSVASGRLTVRASDNSALTRLSTFENLSGIDKFIMTNDGRTAWGANGTAFVNGTIGHSFRSTNLTFGLRIDSAGDSSAALWIQQSGASLNGVFVSMNSTQVGNVDVIAGNFDNKSNGARTHKGVRGFARNGVQFNIGVEGAVGGGDGVAPAQYGAALSGLAAHALDTLQFGARVVAQYNNAAVSYTKDVIGIYAEADTTSGNAGSTGTAIAAQFLTDGLNGSGLNMAINVPLTGNNGNVVIGANASSANKTMVEVTGDIETIGNTRGLVVEDRTNANRYRIYTDGGAIQTEAA